MKKIWRWLQRIDVLSRQSNPQEVRLKADYPLEARAFREGGNQLQKLSRSWPWRGSQSVFTPQLPLPPTIKRVPSKTLHRRRIRPAIALSISILALTAAMGQRYYRQPELQVGTISPKTVIAPTTESVVDYETTEAQRTAARNGALPVLVPDAEIDEQIEGALEDLLMQANDLRDQAGQFPFLEGGDLSLATQTYVREASAEDWKAVWSVVLAISKDTQANRDASPNLSARLNQRDDFRSLDSQQQRAIRDLIRYQQQATAPSSEALQDIFETVRADFQKAQANLLLLSQAEQSLSDNLVLLSLSAEEWSTVQQQVKTKLNHMLLQGIAEGVPTDTLEVAAQLQLQGTVPKEAEELATDFLIAVLEPNLIRDAEKTRAKAEAAAEKVSEVKIPVQKGEVIIRQGEEIDQTAFVLLDHFELSQRRLNVWGLVGYGVLMSGGVACFLLVERTIRPGLRRQDHVLIVCVLLGVSGLSILGFAVYSLPAVGLLISSFYGSALGATVVSLVALLLPIGTRVSVVPLLASAAGGLVCSLVTPRLRSREELALLGGIVGVIQGAVYLALTWMMTPVALTTWYLPLTGAILQGIYGVVSSVVALGLSPYLEHLFDLVTPIRLAELSSPNRPMLQRLASEAPGTFQHTLFVASLAEAAARALRCNVELVRAGTLYHDIGKMHDPLGFIENQMGGPNKHDEIDDPWISADIIKKHVSEGTVMARRCRLPKAVRAFIPEHQGTMQISFFHHKAMEMQKNNPDLVVEEQEFRYPGPIPQSPETGIVMLADSCEAALRSLKDASPSEALAMVNRILKARWRDGQMVDSGLTREHMSIIAQVFVQVWQQYNHKRIAYPKSVLNPVASRS